MSNLLLLVVLAVLVGGVILVLRAMRGAAREPQTDGLVMLQNALAELTRSMDTKFGESQRAVSEHLRENVRLLQETAEKLGRVDAGQKQVVGIAESLGQLERILKHPKQRGVLGEYYLEMALKNVLAPSHYAMQYAFKDGTIVDAAVFCDGQIIPIDSKFSLENYNRLVGASDDAERKRFEEALRADLKTRIDETAKYVKASEGTCEFALMYIPSEAIFYDLLTGSVGAVSNRDLLEYAAEKKVTIVSPTLFHVVLQTILQNLRQREFHKSAEEIRRRVIDLGRHLANYEVYMQKLDSHLGSARTMFDKASKEFEKIDKDVVKIAGTAANEAAVLAEAPNKTIAIRERTQ